MVSPYHFESLSFEEIHELITSEHWIIRLFGEYLELRKRALRLEGALSCEDVKENPDIAFNDMKKQYELQIEYAKVLESRLMSLFLINYKEKYEDADRMCLAYSTTLMNNDLECEG
jgi:hypothetical protein